MSGKIQGALRALRRGGPEELIWVVRKRLAAKIEPASRTRAKQDQQSAPPVPAPGPNTSSVRPRILLPDQVEHHEALKWFEARRPTYERLVEAVTPFVDRDGVVLDVGANIGFFTKVFAETLDFKGSVHLFEPIPHLAQLCRATLSGADYKITVHEFGLSDEDAVIDIFQSSDGNLGWNTMVAGKAAIGMRPLPVQVRAFDHCGVQETPCFVKIDVEGAESKVLDGMLGAIRAWSPRPTILCEVGWGSGHPEWSQELRTFRKLEDLGYRIEGLDRRPVNVELLDKTTDLLFVPEHLAQTLG